MPTTSRRHTRLSGFVLASTLLGGVTLTVALPAAAQASTAPGAPTVTSVAAGDTKLVVTLRAPSSNGGASLLGYVVTAAAGKQSVSVNTSSTSATISKLTDGVTYTVTARALNANGLGPTSNGVNGTPVLGPVVLTLTASQPTFVPQNTQVTFAGRLTRSANGLAAQQVFVTETYTDGKQVTLGQVVTDVAGSYTFTTTPLYNGQIIITALTASASVPSRVLVSLSTPRVTAQHGRSITVVASSAPGFITGTGRVERAQLQQLDVHGHFVRVLQTSNAAQRVGRHGYAHGVNDVTFNVVLPHSGAYRLAVKVIGTPVNTGATSKSTPVTVTF